MFTQFFLTRCLAEFSQFVDQLEFSCHWSNCFEGLIETRYPYPKQTKLPREKRNNSPSKENFGWDLEWKALGLLMSHIHVLLLQERYQGKSSSKAWGTYRGRDIFPQLFCFTMYCKHFRFLRFAALSWPMGCFRDAFHFLFSLANRKIQRSYALDGVVRGQSHLSSAQVRSSTQSVTHKQTIQMHAELTNALG